MDNLQEQVNLLLARGTTLIHENKVKEKDKLELMYEVKELNASITEDNKELNQIIDAGNLLTKLADSRVKKALDFIVKIINDTLIKLFPNDFKAIQVEMDAYHETYPQMRLKLITANDKVRSLKTQEGNGVSQIVSLLYIICLIYISGYRRFVHIDEVLNGLHPDAWELIDDILKLFEEKLDFQFIITQHGYEPKNGRVVYLKKTPNGMTEVARVCDVVDGVAEEVIHV